MSDYYQTLGVDRNASPDEIKRAYRRLASQHHPDKGGDRHKFQEIQRAYSVLSDDQQRAQYDNPSPFGPGGGFQGPGFDFQSIFDMFGARFNHPGQQQFRQQARMSLWITLEDLARGGARTVSVGTQHGTHAVEIDIPQGIDDGDTVQYGGIGPGGMDLIITFRVHPNPRFQRQGLHLIHELTVSVWQLILGTRATVRDVLGAQIEIVIPAGTQPGTLLRVKGRGLTRAGRGTGDLLVRVLNTIPEGIDQDLKDLIEKKYGKSPE